MAITLKFNRSLFLSDFTTLCQSLDAPYSRQTIEDILTAFVEHLDDSYVWLRCTSKPGDVINFRFAFNGRRIDTLTIAANAGWLNNHDTLPSIVRYWGSQGDAEQWCDFDPNHGLAKTWIYFPRLQPMQEILRTPGLSAPVAARIPDLEAAGLVQVPFAAVDYFNKTMNIYFLRRPGLTPEQAATYTALAGSEPPSASDVEIMNGLMQPILFFGVTIVLETGQIPRVAFYAKVENAEDFSPLDARMTKFFAEVPSRDPHRLHIVSWSYGTGDSTTYYKGEANYAGFSDEVNTNMFLRWMDDLI